MTSRGTVFPAFIRLEHQRDGSAKSAFLADVDNLLGSAEQRFRSFGDEAKRQLDSALSTSRTSTGSLDIGAGQARAAADAARQRAIAARELATATAIAAKEQGDFSQQSRLAIVALQAQANADPQGAGEHRQGCEVDAQGGKGHEEAGHHQAVGRQLLDDVDDRPSGARLSAPAAQPA